MKFFSPGESWSHRIVHAGFWSLALQVVEPIFILVRTLVLAVLLWPRDFGLFGLALLTVTALDIFSNMRLDQALIHRRGNWESYLHTVWSVQVIRGLVLALILFGTAPLVAAFYNEPAALPLLRTLCLALIFRGFTNIGVVAFQKQLQFQKEFLFRFSGTLTDMVVAISLAYVLRNAWALVLGFLARTLVEMVVSYGIHPFRPRLALDIDKFKDLLRYGVWIFFGGVTLFIAAHGAGLVVAKIGGAAALGLFQMAQRIPQLTVQSITMAISNVAFPAYSKLQHDPDRLREAYRKFAAMSVMLTIPTAAGIGVVGADFVHLFLGEKWVSMIPALSIMAVSMLILSIAATGKPLFMGGNKPRLVFQLQGIRALSVLVCVYPLVRFWGITGAAVAAALGSTGMFVLWAVQMRRHFKISFAATWGAALGPPLLASVVMAAVIYGYRRLSLPLLDGSTAPALLWFCTLIALGGSTYLGALFLIRRLFPQYGLLRSLVNGIKNVT